MSRINRIFEASQSTSFFFVGILKWTFKNNNENRETGTVSDGGKKGGKKNCFERMGEMNFWDRNLQRHTDIMSFYQTLIITRASSQSAWVS